MAKVGISFNETGDQRLTLEISNQSFVKTENLKLTYNHCRIFDL